MQWVFIFLSLTVKQAEKARKRLAKKLINLFIYYESEEFKAAILALKPKILLLDEPTGELDPSSSRQIFNVLKELNEKHGITVIVVEQKIMLLCEFAKTLGVIDGGKMVYYGSVKDVLQHSDDLEKIGVKCPSVATLSVMLEKEGFMENEIAVNVEEAEKMIRRVIND